MSLRVKSFASILEIPDGSFYSLVRHWEKRKGKFPRDASGKMIDPACAPYFERAVEYKKRYENLSYEAALDRAIATISLIDHGIIAEENLLLKTIESEVIQFLKSRPDLSDDSMGKIYGALVDFKVKILSVAASQNIFGNNEDSPAKDAEVSDASYDSIAVFQKGVIDELPMIDSSSENCRDISEVSSKEGDFQNFNGLELSKKCAFSHPEIKNNLTENNGGAIYGIISLRFKGDLPTHAKFSNSVNHDHLPFRFSNQSILLNSAIPYGDNDIVSMDGQDFTTDMSFDRDLRGESVSVLSNKKEDVYPFIEIDIINCSCFLFCGEAADTLEKLTRNLKISRVSGLSVEESDFLLIATFIRIFAREGIRSYLLSVYGRHFFKVLNIISSSVPEVSDQVSMLDRLWDSRATYQESEADAEADSGEDLDPSLLNGYERELQITTNEIEKIMPLLYNLAFEKLEAIRSHMENFD